MSAIELAYKAALVVGNGLSHTVRSAASKMLIWRCVATSLGGDTGGAGRGAAASELICNAVGGEKKEGASGAAYAGNVWVMLQTMVR